MLHAFGVFLVIAGVLHLALNEFAVQIKRRFKPWWRDTDARTDAWLLNLHRVAVYVGGVVAVEWGFSLAELSWPGLAGRVTGYTLAAVLTVGVLVVHRSAART